MKRYARATLATFAVSLVLLTAGCAPYPGGVTGCGLYTHVTVPAQSLAVALDDKANATKIGQASAYNILGICVFGDAGIDAAMCNGSITKVHHVDHEAHAVIFYARDTTIVYGE
jgi:hypothetical protein